jgi:hypothetical protein
LVTSKTFKSSCIYRSYVCCVLPGWQGIGSNFSCCHPCCILWHLDSCPLAPFLVNSQTRSSVPLTSLPSAPWQPPSRRQGLKDLCQESGDERLGRTLHRHKADHRSERDDNLGSGTDDNTDCKDPRDQVLGCEAFIWAGPESPDRAPRCRVPRSPTGCPCTVVGAQPLLPTMV